MTVRLSYENGTIRVDADGSLPPLPGVEADPRSETSRAPGHRYAAIRRALAVAGVSVDDRVPAWTTGDASSADGDAPSHSRPPTTSASTKLTRSRRGATPTTGASSNFRPAPARL
ncbi:MAG: hypothetical protein A07HR67_01789 [uncultured archaeon A07HR67]|nr:MAG: hypothetical protein A07HR67_01789 [uncultured archaeon A07HR67]